MGFFDSDLAYPNIKEERNKHKRKRLVQGPNAYFMDVKCPNCMAVSVVYSHATSVVECATSGCKTKLAGPTGGKAKLTTGCSFRKKPDY
jgi:small subunit ribosomal protein S27e